LELSYIADTWPIFSFIWVELFARVDEIREKEDGKENQYEFG
jgi:hypothetical protein